MTNRWWQEDYEAEAGMNQARNLYGRWMHPQISSLNLTSVTHQSTVTKHKNVEAHCNSSLTLYLQLCWCTIRENRTGKRLSSVQFPSPKLQRQGKLHYSNRNIRNKVSTRNNKLLHWLLYTGCFTTLGHNCRRWFPRFLWSKSSYKHVSDFGRLQSYGRFLNSRTRPRVNRV